MSTYPTYEETATAAAAAGYQAHADALAEGLPQAEAIARAMRAQDRTIGEWDRNRPMFVAEREGEG